jgi:cytochrome-b5 reductase
MSPPSSVSELLALPRHEMFVWLGTVLVGAVSFLILIFQMAGRKRYKKFLPWEDFVPVPLLKKEVLSHDTARFTLGLPHNTVLGLPTGQHVSLKFNDADGSAIQRSYTPVSDDDLVGAVQLVIKIYKPDPPKFPIGGKLSQHLDSLKIGDTILMKGPKGHMAYMGKGYFTYKPLGKPMQHRNCQTFCMIAGGTGITPMLQVMTNIFKNTNDNSTVVRLLYANKTESDILCRGELQDLVSRFPTRCFVWYTVDDVDATNKATWKYSTGFVSKEMIQQRLVEPAPTQIQFLMCGPPPMIKFACIPPLTELGYSDKDWVVF